MATKRASAGPDEDAGAVLDQWSPKEKEVTLAEIENRLRSMILKILKPSMESTSNLQYEIEDLKTTVRKHDKVLHEVEVLKCVIGQQGELVKMFEVELEKIAANSRSLEERVLEEQSTTRGEMREIRSSLDKKGVQIAQQTREVDRLWEETTRLQRQHEDTKRSVDDRLEQQRAAMINQKDEVMEHIFQLQSQHAQFSQDVWSDEKGIPHLEEELRKVNRVIAVVPDIQQTLVNHEGVMEKFGTRVFACERMVQAASEEMRQIQSSMEDSVQALRADFREVSCTLSAHHAQLAKGMRDGYREELKNAASLRTQVADFMNRTEARVVDVEGQISSTGKHVEHLHKEIVRDLAEVNRKRKRDRLNVEVSLKDSGKLVARYKDEMDGICRGMEHLAAVVNIMLEGNRVDSALCIQDFVDRRQARWLGPKGDTSEPLSPQYGVQGMLSLSRDPIKEEDDRIDARKGFKRLKYNPGAVCYADSMYARHDLLLIREKLLTKAQEALRQGPRPSEGTSLKGVGAGVPAAPPMKAGDSDGFRSKRMSNSGHQRPGSQQQPNAGSSHGRDAGPDGAQPPPVRLPIISDNGTVTSIPKALTAR